MKDIFFRLDKHGSLNMCKVIFILKLSIMKVLYLLEAKKAQPKYFLRVLFIFHVWGSNITLKSFLNFFIVIFLNKILKPTIHY